MQYPENPPNGFTLIELSIVLVIIGLIAGGVLVGRDLIAAAGVRATIAQFEQFNTAVKTFHGKYGALPGDLSASVASAFGFAARGQYEGQGDGNGIIEGAWQNAAASNFGNQQIMGETPMVWVDLTSANGMNINLIPGRFSTASPTVIPSLPVSGTTLERYLPQAKIGGGNYFHVTSSLGVNYFGLTKVTEIQISPNMSSGPGLSVRQAFNIDTKMDDGLPQSGRATALYLNNVLTWAGTVGTGATAGSSATCYDNANVAAAVQKYSVSQGGGNHVNCALLVVFQ